MSTKHDDDSQPPPKPPKPHMGRPAGGVSLFGTNPGLLGEMRARMRKFDITNTDASDSPTVSPSNEVLSSPPKPTSYPTDIHSTSDQVEKARPTVSDSKAENSNSLLLNLTENRARRPRTRPPSFRPISSMLLPINTDNPDCAARTTEEKLSGFFNLQGVDGVDETRNAE
ncbi:hypothetical protein EG68_07619 [Paragonimus skrjabini miyazakii]|uniref:Uncharacterized protein n=1 Tax=Paragonimus skrjabini miyazakii TaxID=59628 RepID=A0A8S9YAB9_9TREM|nr:hypothetical protein EG68_07619 [Paragonimus skrjabini miyazakii]